MNSHLALFVDNREIALTENFSIDIEDRNPLFNESEMFSYPVQIPLTGNRWLVKNVDDPHATIRPVSLEHKPMSIYADGIPFRSGTMVMQDDERVTDSLSMNMDAGTQSFSDLISDLTCRDVPVKDKICIGEKIGNVHATLQSNPQIKVRIHFDGDKRKEAHDETRYVYAEKVSVAKDHEPQALGYSYPAGCVEWNSAHEASIAYYKYYKGGQSVPVPHVASGQDYINVSAAYGETDGAGRFATYCNARICYKHYNIDEDGQTADSTVPMKESLMQNEDMYPYWVLDARRPQSGICFYVLYFLDCLFAHLKVSFDNTALLAIEDMKHLCFFTTNCCYDFERKYSGGYDLKSIEEINAWLSSRGCGGTLDVVRAEDKEVQEVTLKVKGGGNEHYEVNQQIDGGKITGITIEADVRGKALQANIMNMYANSDNFPDESVSTVIESLESAFGIKFHYDSEHRHVTAYLLRDVFRTSSTSRKFHCNVVSMVPVSEKITGVRMRYSEEADRKEQEQNIKDSRKNRNMGYETDYNYIDYPEPGGAENSTIYNKHFRDFFRNLSNGDKHVYIDANTGNAYRIKVNSEATTNADLKPVLFEVGQYKGVEYGECRGENEDFIHDITIDFQPVPFNDVNYFNELNLSVGVGGTATDPVTGKVYTLLEVNKEANQPCLCAFADVDMEHEFVEQILNVTMAESLFDFYLQHKLNLVESYNPGDTEDGNSPLQDPDMWGFSLALMRGGGTNMTQQQFDYNYDGFGNSKWRNVVGKYALAADSLDQMGNEFDYNGVQEGIGKGERFSLKIRAYKEPEWLSDPKYKNVVLCNPDVKDAQGNVTDKIRSRGLFDTFMLPYAFFLVNRKKLVIECTTTIAQLADIPNHWNEWWQIGEMKCLIDTVNTTISAKDGLQKVELTVYAL